MPDDGRCALVLSGQQRRLSTLRRLPGCHGPDDGLLSYVVATRALTPWTTSAVPSTLIPVCPAWRSAPSHDRTRSTTFPTPRSNFNQDATAMARLTAETGCCRKLRLQRFVSVTDATTYGIVLDIRRITARLSNSDESQDHEAPSPWIRRVSCMTSALPTTNGSSLRIRVPPARASLCFPGAHVSCSCRRLVRARCRSGQNHRVTGDVAPASMSTNTYHLLTLLMLAKHHEWFGQLPVVNTSVRRQSITDQRRNTPVFYYDTTSP